MCNRAHGLLSLRASLQENTAHQRSCRHARRHHGALLPYIEQHSSVIHTTWLALHDVLSTTAIMVYQTLKFDHSSSSREPAYVAPLHGSCKHSRASCARQCKRGHTTNMSRQGDKTARNCTVKTVVSKQRNSAPNTPIPLCTPQNTTLP